MSSHIESLSRPCPNCDEPSTYIEFTRPYKELLECPHCGYLENITKGTVGFMSLEGLNRDREFYDLPPLKELPIRPKSDEQFKEHLKKRIREFGFKMRKQGVQNTLKNRPSESQQNQGVKSSDLDVQKGNVL